MKKEYQEPTMAVVRMRKVLLQESSAGFSDNPNAEEKEPND